MRGARQHAVFSGDPALVLAAQESGHTFLDAGGTQYARVAELDQHRAFGMAGEIPGEAHRAQLVRRAAAGSGTHQPFPIQRTTAAEVLSAPAPTTFTARSARRSSSSRSGARAGGNAPPISASSMPPHRPSEQTNKMSLASSGSRSPSDISGRKGSPPRQHSTKFRMG